MKEGGTGLRLAIAARILQEHGGKPDIGGELGQGAFFTPSPPTPFEFHDEPMQSRLSTKPFNQLAGLARSR
ncbi:hypothetical protein [Cystobacter fuscus]|uniref:hypothetical protein n=1 Tax=Cystobacter fuscus TaxID=43 RepID=UPI0037BEA46C